MGRELCLHSATITQSLEISLVAKPQQNWDKELKTTDKHEETSLPQKHWLLSETKPDGSFTNSGVCAATDQLVMTPQEVT